MRIPWTGISPGGWSVILGLSVLIGVLLPVSSGAAEIHLSSRTYLLHYEQDSGAGGSRTFTPLYEYLSGDAGEIGGHPVSFHFYGWGRQDLGEDTGSGDRSGEIGSAYLEYRHPTGNGEVRVGRFFFAEGTAAEILDGAFLKVRSRPGLGISVFGGIPVERSITGTDEGDSLYGSRIFYSRAGVMEVGVGYLKEKGKFQGDDRETVGGDLWLRPGLPVELTGRAAYNVSTSALASQRYALRILPLPRLDLAVGYDEYRYRDLFQTSLHPVFLPPFSDNNDKVRSIFGIADVTVAEGVTVEAGVKQIRHELDDPGDSLRGDVGIRVAYNDRKDLAGISAAFVSADLDENEYQEFRAFGSYSPGPFRFTLDALTHRYKKAVAGSTIRDAYQVTGSAGWRPLPYLRLSADLIYTRSPRFTEDYAGLIRVALDLDREIRGEPAPSEEPAPSPGKQPAAAPAVPPKPVSPPALPGPATAPPPEAKPDTVAAYLDRMGAEIRSKFPGSHVERKGDILVLRLSSDFVFASGEYDVKDSARESVVAVASILKKFPETLVTVEGHTDSTGAPGFNQVLSEKRARSVFDLLVREEVSPLRISMRGYGETIPLEDNGTPEGRRKNRRVELKFRPNRTLKHRLGQGR